MKGLVWIAQGFGVGRISVAPGTFGSALGVAWFLALLATGSLWGLIGGTLAGLALSVWLCGVGERALGKKDPGSVVLDEIAAMPACFCAWLAILTLRAGSLPAWDHVFAAGRWRAALGIFAAFRLFDVLKPWPVRQSQSLPGGWGVTVDDVLAAVYVNLLVLLVYGGMAVFGRSLS